MSSRGGRPPTPPEAKPVIVSLRLPPWVYDHYCRQALKTGDAVHALLRRAVLRGVSRSAKTRRRPKRPHTVAGSPTPGTG